MQTSSRAIAPLVLKPKRISYLWGYEEWCISAHARADCQIVGGAFNGWTLSRLWSEHRELFGAIEGDVFPLLVKVIDTDRDVSIQLHPDDSYAREHENGALGKSECWYVMGLSRGTTTAVLGNQAKDRKDAERMIRGRQWSQFLREVPIRVGSFVQIDPGTIHSAHGGTRFLETQENSDITYRLYDYDRLENGVPRQLHTEQAIACVRAPDPTQVENPRMEEREFGKYAHLVDRPSYSTDIYVIEGKMRAEFRHAFTTVSIVAGRGSIGGVPVEEDTYLILPSGLGPHEWEGNFTALVSWPPDSQS